MNFDYFVQYLKTKTSMNERWYYWEIIYKRICQKVFEFMQVRHPDLYVKMCLLWKTYINADEENLWFNIRLNQEKILHKKRIKHRNFWDYSKHNCWYENCPLNGIMVQQWSWFCESSMRGANDTKKQKSERRKSERKRKKQIITEFLSNS